MDSDKECDILNKLCKSGKEKKNCKIERKILLGWLGCVNITALNNLQS